MSRRQKSRPVRRQPDGTEGLFARWSQVLKLKPHVTVAADKAGQGEKQ
jgi:hypothetical protein